MTSIPFLKLSDYSLNLTACTEFAHNDLNIPHLKTPELQPVSTAFRLNIARIRFMMLVPAHLGDLSTRMQHLLDIAVHETTGSLTDFSHIENQPEIVARTTARFRELFDKELEDRVKDRDGSTWHETALDSLKASTAPAEMLGSVIPLSLGLEAMLRSYLTGTWTAFETMCGDLWETALNIDPSRLAHLNGNPKRLLRKTPEAAFRPDDRADSKAVPLDLIERYGFDVKHRMGTILRRSRFEFSRLSDIRRAYSSAFDIDHSQIDEALSHKSIDALQVVRNVIVHRGGNADEPYMKLMQTYKLPVAGLGRPLILNGSKVVEMISPVIGYSGRLMTAVDNWLIKHRAKPLGGAA